MKFVKYYDAVGLSFSILEFEKDGKNICYFHTNEGISIHKNAKNVFHCLNGLDTFYMKLSIKKNAIPIANEIINADGTPDFIKTLMNEYIEDWNRK